MSLLAAAFGLVTMVLNYYMPLLVYKNDLWDVGFSSGFIILFVIPYYSWLKRIDRAFGVSETLPSDLLLWRGPGPSFRLTVVMAGIAVDAVLPIGALKEHYPALYLLTHALSPNGLIAFQYFLQVDPLPPCRGYLFEKINWCALSPLRQS